MKNVSFLLDASNLTPEITEKLETVANKYSGKHLRYGIFAGAQCKLPISSYPHLQFFLTKTNDVSPLQKAITVIDGHWLVFARPETLITDGHLIAELLHSTHDGLAVVPITNRSFWARLMGVRDVTSAPFIAFEKNYARQHISHEQDLLKALRRADKRASINLSYITLKSTRSVFNTKTLLIRPTFSIIVLQIKDRLVRTGKGIYFAAKLFIRKLAYRYLIWKTPKIEYDANIPTFIICRDRVEPLKKLVEWLEAEGLKNLIFIDNNSTYPPLVDYLHNSPYEVIELYRNSGHTSPWKDHIINTYAKDRAFIVTDPDVLPIKGSHGAIKRFIDLLNQYPQYRKAGFGLKIDDLPDEYELKESVITWESQYWLHEIEQEVYDADTDTTLCVYRAGTPYIIRPALRTGKPFLARHEPWYTDSNNISDEVKYYREHADKAVGSWGLKKGDLAEVYVTHENNVKDKTAQDEP